MRRSSAQTRPGGYLHRPVGTREPRQRFLVVCEGEKTEPNYFKAFRAPGRVVFVRGVGGDAYEVVQEAVRQRDESDYDRVWCVFDRDEVPLERFNRAMDFAHREDVQVAYSNEAFELWYLLHFCYLSTGMARSSYATRLTDYLGSRYEKNATDIFARLYSRQEQAIRNAERLLSTYSRPSPAEDNPSTTVHRLVCELRRSSPGM